MSSLRNNTAVTTDTKAEVSLNGTSLMAERMQPFVCGGSAAIFASTVIHPMDLTKTRLQLHAVANPGAASPGLVGMMRQTVAQGGFRGLYAGLDAAIGRQAVYGTARIGLHRTFSDKLAEHHGGSVPFWQKVLSGMSSGAMAVCVGTPFDIALVRLQNDSSLPASERRGYKNVGDALVRVSREEGFRTLYNGLTPNILRGMSMNVGMLTVYDQAKEVSAGILGDPNPAKPQLPTKLLSACTAGFFCAFLSLPFDMVKSRLMNMKPNAAGELPYKGVVDCATQIARKEGIPKFWTGFSAYYGRCAPHAMIILLSIESITQNYREHFGLDKK